MTTPTNPLIKIRVIGTTNTIEETTDAIINDLSKNFELLEQSKVYSSRGNQEGARVYLTFKQKEQNGGATPEVYEKQKLIAKIRELEIKSKTLNLRSQELITQSANLIAHTSELNTKLKKNLCCELH